MLKVAQKEIKNFPATDITTWGEKKLAELPRLEEIAYSIGVYGCNGKLLHGTDGKFYKIQAGRRTSSSSENATCKIQRLVT